MSDESSEIINQTVALLTGVNETKVKFLTNMNELLKLRNNLFEHEASRVRNLSAEPDIDPRVKMLEDNIKAAEPVINTIATQIEIGRISVPRLKEGEIIIHGRVTDEIGHGIENLMVSLVVEGKTLDVTSKSDASGYYSIVLPTAIVDKIKERDIIIYIYYGTVLVHKATDAIKIIDQQTKFEVMLSQDEIKMIHLP